MPGPGAPALIEPRVGWRVWDVVELDGALRLCSLAFWAVWPARREATAACRRSLLEPALARLPPHYAPRERCGCGIHGTRTAAAALDFGRQVSRKPDSVARVAGRVSLWGTVVECEDGWRASHAYPSRLLVPAARAARRLVPGRGGLATAPAEGVAAALEAYGVPVDVVDRL
ncbi:MAG: hypothetical protein IT201_05615 [Thermoleophilia bacterium]|nr:hypothetical protein [Thermoleophilia bacterium]